MMLFEKGTRAPFPFDQPAGKDGMLLDLTQDGDFIMPIYCHGMSNEERKSLCKDKIKTGYFSDPPFWLGVFKIGRLIFDVSFDPSLPSVNFTPDIFRKDYMTLIAPVIDSKDMIVQTTRFLTFPPQLMSILYFTYAKFEANASYSERYAVFLARWERYTLEELWEYAQKSGSFGDD